MHADKRYRANLATDLIEPARHKAEELTLDRFESRTLARRDVTETRRGTCRLGPPLVAEITGWSSELRQAAGEHAELVATTLAGRKHYPTAITRRRHKASIKA